MTLDTEWNLPWPLLRLPTYLPAKVESWSIRQEQQVAQFGYFQDWQGQSDIYALYFDEQTWMSTAWDEVDSQAPHVATAYGHVVVMGAGMGVVLYNLLPMRQVERVTLVERDPLVIDVLRKSTGFEQWPGAGKLQIEIIDALEYRPKLPVDHLYADIWAMPGEMQTIVEMQGIQSRVQARQLGWWGQELHFLDWLHQQQRALSPTLENYRIWAAELGLPLIEQNNPAYISSLKQVSKSYCYKMFLQDPARAKSAQPSLLP